MGAAVTLPSLMEHELSAQPPLKLPSALRRRQSEQSDAIQFPCISLPRKGGTQ